jgi:hypothetical protein
VLPQLAQPWWYRLVGTHHHDENTELSPEALRIKARKQRKRAKRLRSFMALVAGPIEP